MGFAGRRPAIGTSVPAWVEEASQSALTASVKRAPCPATSSIGTSTAAQSGDRTERPAKATSTFRSVLCGVERSANSRTARDQAELLAWPGGTVEFVPAPRLTRHGPRSLQEFCEGHDLLVLGADAAARAAIAHTPIPILIARWGRFGTKVTDSILVPIDDSRESIRAAALAGRLAAVHAGKVTILGAPSRDAALQRAIAASRRILFNITGAAPHLFNEQLGPERAIPSAAVTLDASLVVLGSGSSKTAKNTTHQIAGRIGCSVLAVPTAEPIAPAGDAEGSESDA